MNIRNFLFSHQIEAVEETAPEPVIVREDFFFSNINDMTISKILHTLRERTIRFTENNNLTWGVTEIETRGIALRVKLTENQDVQYFINGFPTFDMKTAIQEFHAQIQF
jgi:hypothetical protein